MVEVALLALLVPKYIQFDVPQFVQPPTLHYANRCISVHSNSHFDAVNYKVFKQGEDPQ